MTDFKVKVNTRDFSHLNVSTAPGFFVRSSAGMDQQQLLDTGPKEALCNRINDQGPPIFFQVVHPEELNLIKPKTKRGRPKQNRSEETKQEKMLASATSGSENMISEKTYRERRSKKNRSAEAKREKRTASETLESEKMIGENTLINGRTRSGRLVKLPKYIEKDFKSIVISNNEDGIQTSDFKRVEEKENNKRDEFIYFTKKRVISSQFRCPKCLKAYMGKGKMIEHLKKYPDHGPLPEGYQRFNFDVWNYLFDITQKCQPGQRGAKFCEELSNLLHNLQLLKSALFKTVKDSKNCVQVDRVLGNALGLAPGKYQFDENELYKDVTVLKLITNTEFFTTNLNNKDGNEHGMSQTRELEKDAICAENMQNKKLKQDEKMHDVSIPFSNVILNNGLPIQNSNATENFIRNERDENVHSIPLNNIQQASSLIPDHSFAKKDIDSPILHPDILTENLLLHNLPTTRNSVDDLILSNVDTGSNLLDNSTSSDEVMNVDQFVNERFKKIIEPDIELGNGTLNLDLPSLELFNFHTT